MTSNGSSEACKLIKFNVAEGADGEYDNQIQIEDEHIPFSSQASGSN